MVLNKTVKETLSSSSAISSNDHKLREMLFEFYKKFPATQPEKKDLYTFTKLYETIMESNFDLYEAITTKSSFIEHNPLFSVLTSKKPLKSIKELDKINTLLKDNPSLIPFVKNNIFLIDSFIKNKVKSPLTQIDNCFLDDFMLKNLNNLEKVSEKTKKLLLLNTLTKLIYEYEPENNERISQLLFLTSKMFPTTKDLTDSLNKNLFDLNKRREETKDENISYDIVSIITNKDKKYLLSLEEFSKKEFDVNSFLILSGEYKESPKQEIKKDIPLSIEGIVF